MMIKKAYHHWQTRGSTLAKRYHETVSARKEDPASGLWGEFSVIFGMQVSLQYWLTTVKERLSMFHNSAVIKQWTAKWHCIANAIFQIVKNQAD